MIKVERFDHLVLTVADIERTQEFYRDVLGMEPVTFADDRHGLAFGVQRINLHPSSEAIAPAATYPVPGSADVCLVTLMAISEVKDHLRACEVRIEEGPVTRVGALGPMISLYFRDPDGNLIEVSRYEEVEE
ncbi:VOC family protein [Actinoalloteichus hymeniacidonis]|uniref:VOC family protein n=1 Tax=Actinoalloteichus hymeniacidonis TaxID=340345 RepID=UPI000852AC32|nr:VOC family protein [Actinoalloteichus hymeniacidonis]MBB5909108.1 catechol 2,3-dioxygenase-like lactoylglutathione lyase family enzyme [Actinoalloteichus hymeniacidonis]